MLTFKNFIIENENEQNGNNGSQEQLVQDKHFGVNDYIPFKNASLDESVEDHPTNEKRLIFRGERHQGKAEGAVVPRHMWEGAAKLPGMKERNKMRAEVYGSENRPPLTKTEIHKLHASTLEDHFSKPKSEQLTAEKEAIARLKKAGHLNSGDTTDDSEKTDTINHETDDKGRFYTAAASKGVAGHAVYTSGTGEHEKHHIMNTCLGQTEGCGGGVDADKLADTSKGTCFAPKAETQYPGAAIRRACHAQAKHDPAMSKDWILAHTASLRNRAEKADKQNKRFIFRPNVVDETDTTSRLAIKHLNKQRKAESTPEKEKPSIQGYGYGKTGDVHDPENGWHSTYSNTGPKVKNGKSISENIQRDNNRIKETIHASAGKDTNGNELHHTNDEGEKTPPKNSYLVLNAKRNSDLAKKFQEHVTHAKYWSKGREHSELSPEEKSQGPEGHFDGEGKVTTPENSHYGHVTVNGRRYDYQKQHILHPRMVRVPITKKGKTSYHDIPTDSRFKDDEYLPKNRFKARNGKNAGGILATTPTESTSSEQHHSNFTHHVDEDTIKHAINHHGEYEIDKPEDQEKARINGEYAAPRAISITPKNKIIK